VSAMDLELRDRVALVTGGATGIGLAGAQALADEGVRVVISGRRAEVGERAAAAIRETGGLAHFIQADVSRTADVQTLVEGVLAHYDRLDFLVNNAGIEGTPFVPAADYREEDWDAVIAVNLKGTWLCMKYAIPHLLERPGAAIVNVSSIGGINGGSL